MMGVWHIFWALGDGDGGGGGGSGDDDDNAWWR